MIIGEDEIVKIYLGTTEVVRMYLGETLIYGEESENEQICQCSRSCWTLGTRATNWRFS